VPREKRNGSRKTEPAQEPTAEGAKTVERKEPTIAAREKSRGERLKPGGEKKNFRAGENSTRSDKN